MKAKARKQDEWRLIVEDFIRSGQEASEYCRQRQIHLMTFKHRYYKLRPKPDITNTEGEFAGFRLLHCQATEATAKGAEVKVSLPNGIRMEISTNDVIALVKGLANAV